MMPKDKSNDFDVIKKKWDEHAQTYDEWYETFEGAVEHHVEWELLKGYLPKKKGAKILDAAGGTGRITLPLAKLGYSVTLCDISPKMLGKARQKIIKKRISDKVEILECDVHHLPFTTEYFDLVICWDGMFEAAKELIRVTKKKGRISIFLMNKWSPAIKEFFKDPDHALHIIKSIPSYANHDKEKYQTLTVDEAKKFFHSQGIRVFDVYAVCGLMDLLSIPHEVLESRNWDEKSFDQVTEMLLRWSKEPSVKGISRHLVVYGEKI